MCGIAGLVGVEQELAHRRVAAALRRLAHRGPDGEGYYAGPDAVLGMRRLAIIDLVTGDQPIYNEDRSVAVVCNGELYNYIERLGELRQRGHAFQSRSDVNLVPHLYEELGRDAFTAIRGMFAVAVWDERQQRLTLARDRVGKKPLFYAQAGNGIAFASELPALLALLDRVPEYSQAALADYLRLGCVPHPATIYQGVFALAPGSTLVFQVGGSPDIAAYWTPQPQPPFQGSRTDALQALDGAIRESVALRLRSDVPVGLFLSGGVDSGLIASYAAQAGARDLLCFVVEVEDPALNEASAARRTAEWLGLPIETVPLQISAIEAVERVPLLYGQPFGDSSAIPSYFVSRAASRHRKVVLNGDGGDEVFAGYRRYWLGRAGSALGRFAPRGGSTIAKFGRFLARHGRRRSGLGFIGRALRGVGVSEADRYLMWTVDLMSDQDVVRCFPDLARQGATLDRLARMRGEATSCASLRQFLLSDYRLLLPDDLLVKMDIASMANSLEARSPLLDVPLAEWSWSLPERWLLDLSETKPLLRALARSRLPPEIATAPKRGFEVPMERWLHQELKDVVEDLLLASDSHVLALGDRKQVEALIRRKDAFAGNYSQLVWALLALEVFLRAPAPGD